jgi:hypothetical protein
VEDNVTTNGVERHLTMANVHVADSLGYANELMVIGPYGSFDGTNVTFSQDNRSTATSTSAGGSPCVEINAQVSGTPHFSCTDCVFRNCSSIGTGGGVTASPSARLTLVRPKFIDCLAGYIGWSHTHKPGFGDGCYCEGADPRLCTGCTCRKGTAGGGPGFYCDSDSNTLKCDAALQRACPDHRDFIKCVQCSGVHQHDLQAAGCNNTAIAAYCSGDAPAPDTDTCTTTLEGLCGNAKGSSPGDCLICCGSHQQALQAAGCDSQDFASFCG